MKKTKPVALFLGRFQPFHKGHLAALKWIAARSGKVLVVIGSAEKENEPKNPFSEKERERMIRAQLLAAGLSRKCTLASVTDINDNEKWVAHVDKSVPRYDIAYSNNSLVKRLMKSAGKKVSAVPFFRKGTFNATKIRGRMKKGTVWRDRVPKKVGEMLGKIKAEERMRKL
ncbi:MAG: nicotinamide-nucleotide adenylyltransferase [Candidatus Micrarchaeia archaeon]